MMIASHSSLGQSPPQQPLSPPLPLQNTPRGEESASAASRGDETSWPRRPRRPCRLAPLWRQARSGPCRSILSYHHCPAAAEGSGTLRHTHRPVMRRPHPMSNLDGRGGQQPPPRRGAKARTSASFAGRPPRHCRSHAKRVWRPLCGEKRPVAAAGQRQEGLMGG